MKANSKQLVLKAKLEVIETFSNYENTVFNLYYNNHSKTVADAISYAEKVLIPYVGSTKNNRLSFEQLDTIQKWLKEKFVYVGDEESFNKSDYWDASAWVRAILCDRFHGDCDDFGYAVLGILYYVFNYSKRDLARVACLTEINVGHFVTWVKDDKGYTWQLENRIGTPLSIQNRLERGYKFLYYSTMETKNIANDKWYDANQKVKQLLFDNFALLAKQPIRKEVDPIDAINYIEKSKTLKASAGTITVGTIGVATGLANQQDWKVVGMFALVLIIGLIFWYLRAVTVKPLREKE